MISSGGGKRALRVQKTINIDASLDEVFAYFTSWERWPNWMSHVRSVTVTGPRDDVGGRTHWEVDGPAGAKVSWDAEITEFERNRLVSWKTIEGDPIRHAGTMCFDRSHDGTVRVDIHMTYNPPGGVAGHAIAKLLARDPKRQTDADLARLKTTIESGTSRRDVAASS